MTCDGCVDKSEEIRQLREALERVQQENERLRQQVMWLLQPNSLKGSRVVHAGKEAREAKEAAATDG